MTADYLSAEDMDEAMALAFPEGFTQKANRRISLSEVVTDWGPLTEAHAQIATAHMESGATLGVHLPHVTNLRHSHHRLAQLLAGGMNAHRVAALCNTSANYLCHLQDSPAFQELLAHYAATQEDAFGDFVETAAALSMDMLGRLQEILNNEPEKLSPSHVLESIKLLADRTGHAPVSKSVNVNVNTGLGDKLRLARERAQEVYITSNVVPD